MSAQANEDPIVHLPRFEKPAPQPEGVSSVHLLFKEGWYPLHEFALNGAVPYRINTAHTNDAEREYRMRALDWRPNRTRIACVDEPHMYGMHPRCTYEAFVSYFAEKELTFKRVIIPPSCPEWARGWYLRWKVGSYTYRFPSDYPLVDDRTFDSVCQIDELNAPLLNERFM